MDEALRRSAAHVLVPALDAPALDEASWHHLRRVVRLRPGVAVTATDGSGRWRTCRFGSGSDLEVDGGVVAVPPPRSATVVVAPPKGDRLDWLVQKCTEVGVTRIVLVHAERSVVRWDDERAAKHLERLRRIAIEAALQSRRVWLPELCGPQRAVDVLPGAAVAEPGGRPIGPDDRCIAVGPEGGWTDGELAVAHDRISLGPNVLRVETAAVVAATLMAVTS